MIEEIKEFGNLKRVEHRLLCPTCRIELEEDRVLMTYPCSFEYKCPQCGYTTTSWKSYPYTEIVGEPLCTYQQEVKS